MSTATQVLPVIDLAGHLSGGSRATEHAAEEVRSALTKFGFFSIVGHGIPWEQVTGIYDQAARFHALPTDVKTAIMMGPHNMGYVPLGGAQRGDRPSALNAAFFMGRPGSRRNRFPDDAAIPGFGDATVAYYEAMHALGRRLLPLYALAAGLSEEEIVDVATGPDAARWSEAETAVLRAADELQ